MSSGFDVAERARKEMQEIASAEITINILIGIPTMLKI